ncbi:MAG: sodium:proton antiporter [Pirellulales bacterium]
MKDQLWLIAPFAILLGCIAILPLTVVHWWEQNRSKAIVVTILTAPLAMYLATAYGHEGQHKLLHTAVEYVLFLSLLGSLYVVSGGIYVQGSLSGTPLVNTGMLAIGAVLASVIGTTGASMVLIRPLIRANASRKRMTHVVVFFIFIVSNCGGLLTPLGDPPLFLGFMKGVPFEWTLKLLPQWAFVNGVLLIVFNVWDQAVLNREERERAGSQLEQVQKHEPLRIVGLVNIAFFAAIVVINLAAGYKFFERLSGGEQGGQLLQAGAMIAVAGASYLTTSKAIHHKNNFGFGPIIEVAVIFAGIFIAMIPALAILDVRGAELGVDTPAKYFWAGGILSSFLDNAPTYLTFAATACGTARIPVEGEYLAVYLAQPGAAGAEAAWILKAISCGAVFMGANTYIGNGPNFMVKAIAEQNNVTMPGFFGYMAYSVGILIPIFIAATFLFFL